MRKSVIAFVILYYAINFLILPYLFVVAGSWLQLSRVQSLALQVLGIFLIGLSMVNIVYCYRYFLKKSHGAPMSFQPAQIFLSDGPFARTRNPLYLSQFVIISGEFLFFGSYALLVYLVVFVGIYNFIVIPLEEAENKKRFGLKYMKYKKITPRYL